MYVLANLGNDQLKALQSFEHEKGCKVLALSNVNVEPAKVEETVLSQLKDLEKELGLCLVAVR